MSIHSLIRMALATADDVEHAPSRVGWARLSRIRVAQQAGVARVVDLRVGVVSLPATWHTRKAMECRMVPPMSGLETVDHMTTCHRHEAASLNTP